MARSLRLCLRQLHLGEAHLLFHVHLEATFVEHVDAIVIIILARCEREISALIHAHVVLPSCGLLARHVRQRALSLRESPTRREPRRVVILVRLRRELVERLRIDLVEHMASVTTPQ